MGVIVILSRLERARVVVDKKGITVARAGHTIPLVEAVGPGVI
jgi:hypothetical protein